MQGGAAASPAAAGPSASRFGAARCPSRRPGVAAAAGRKAAPSSTHHKRWKGAKIEVETVYSSERGWLVDYDVLVEGTTRGLDDDDEYGFAITGQEADDGGDGESGSGAGGPDDDDGMDSTPGGRPAQESLPTLTSLMLPPRRRAPRAARPVPAADGDAIDLPAPSPAGAAAEPRRVKRSSLKIVAGTHGGRRLSSPSDQGVRPMMEVVRAACFSMLHALGGRALEGGRWLDLYSGTGAVGLEAISRGAAEAHFVELDPWVIANVLGPNVESLGAGGKTRVHAQRVEDFLAAAAVQMAAGPDGPAASAWSPFDFVSVTPPYEAVSYGPLMAALGGSPLLRPTAFVVTEYPSRDKATGKRMILDATLGPLVKLRDRAYGRTRLAVYGPAHLADRAACDD